MRNGSMKCEIILLPKFQKQILKCTQPAQTELFEDKGRYKQIISLCLESIPQYKKATHM